MSGADIEGFKPHSLPEDRRSQALDLIEEALRQAQEARRDSRTLRSVIPLPEIEPIQALGMKSHQQAGSSSDYYRRFMDLPSIKVKNRGKKAQLHRVDGRHFADPDVSIRYETLGDGENIVLFKARAKVRVKHRRHLPLLGKFR